MRPFEATITYAADAATVAAMLADPAYVERKVAASGPVSSSVDVTGDLATGFTVTTQRALPTTGMPPAVQNLIGATIELRLVERWGPASSDGSRTGSVVLDVVGKPARAQGSTALTPSGSTSVLTYSGQVEARIPLIGGRIEQQAVAQVQSVLEVERAVGADWLAQA